MFLAYFTKIDISNSLMMRVGMILEKNVTPARQIMQLQGNFDYAEFKFADKFAVEIRI